MDGPERRGAPTTHPLRRRIEELVVEVREDAELEEEERERLRAQGDRAAALADRDDWLTASSVLLEAAELERRATGERGAWWALWLDVHDALIAGELGDWSA
ncbi:MAG: hypothetical protein M9894_11620 [Planctomycetes bacterium]|nr:hypothetical protein [Planctomycetota bacterium]